MKTKLVRLLATGLGLAAVIFVTTACFAAGHRPEVPAELLKK
ncbi:cyclic lactone autoinducer peptide [Cohnella sp. CFH 77786]|nr:cyclic lactone autoinducer peptide [Cohnella sp. CFH 77786]MBW5447274.1 cyclic lactone autoinducer peptide [Cohnella sp. CFH 77786]